jgi:hypothetical protein
MAGTEHQRRRFVTRHDVEDAAAAGRPIRLQGRDVVTDEAAQRAMDLGVAIEREGRSAAGWAGASGGSRSGEAAGGPATGAQGSSSGSGSVSPDQLRRAVRAAVIAELGSEPPGLDAAIEKVLRAARG